MEPTTGVATAIASLIFEKALKQKSEELGEALVVKSNSLLNLLHQKFKEKEEEDLLKQVQNNPTEESFLHLRAELAQRMYEDPEFANNLTQLLKQLKLTDVEFNRHLRKRVPSRN